jgi:hypothetical protein
MEESSHVEEGLQTGERQAKGGGRTDNTRYSRVPLCLWYLFRVFRFSGNSSEGNKSGGKGRESNFRHKIQMKITITNHHQSPTPTRTNTNTNTNTNNSQQHSSWQLIFHSIDIDHPG